MKWKNRIFLRRQTAVALCVCLCLALCACSTAAQDTAQSASGASSPGIPGAAPVVSNENDAPLRTLTLDTYEKNSANAQAYYGLAVTQMGYYGWRVNFSTGQIERLCTLPDCTHTQESCEAMANPEAEVLDVKIFADEDCLYWILPSGGKSSVTEGKPTEPYVQVSGLRGENRRTLFTLPQGTYLDNTNLVTDGETMYLMQLLPSKDKTKPSLRRIVAVDMATGEIKFTYEMTGMQSRLLGTLDGKLLFCMTTLAPGCPEPPRYEVYNYLVNRETVEPYMRIAFYTLTTDGAQCEEVYQQNTPYFISQYRDGKLYAVDKTQHSLTATSLATGETVTLAQDLPENLTLDSVWRDYIMLDHSTALPDGGSDRTLYIFDRATGEVRESPLRCLRKMEPDFPTVMSESDGDFVVISDEVFTQRTIVGTGGMPYQAQYFRSKFSLIDQQDFFDGVPSYRAIEVFPDMDDELR